MRLVWAISDADARVMGREAEAAGASKRELKAFLDQANNSRLWILQILVCEKANRRGVRVWLAVIRESRP